MPEPADPPDKPLPSAFRPGGKGGWTGKRRNRRQATVEGIFGGLLLALLVPMGASAPSSPLSGDELSGQEIVRRVLEERENEPYHVRARLYPLDSGPRNPTHRNSRPVPLEIFNRWQPDRVETLFRLETRPGTELEFLTRHDFSTGSWTSFAGRRGEPRIEIQAGQLSTRIADLDFTLEDLIFSFLRWPRHQTEQVTRSKGRPCWVLLHEPQPEQSGQYGRVRSWIDREGWFPLRIDGYRRDDPDRLLRRLEIISVRKEGEEWQLSKIEARDMERRTRTRLEILSIDRGATIQPDLFQAGTD